MNKIKRAVIEMIHENSEYEVEITNEGYRLTNKWTEWKKPFKKLTDIIKEIDLMLELSDLIEDEFEDEIFNHVHSSHEWCGDVYCVDAGGAAINMEDGYTEDDIISTVDAELGE